MIGVIARCEIMLSSRRSKFDLLRCCYGGLCLLEFGGLAIISHELFRTGTGVVFQQYCGLFYRFLIAQQIVLIILLTLVFGAGAITDEKVRGTLQLLLAANASAVEIVLGKFLGRAAQTARFLVIGWPLLFTVAGFAGVPLVDLLLLIMGTIIFAVGIMALSILASVWFHQTRDAIFFVYAFACAGFSAWIFNLPGAVWTMTWLDAFNPHQHGALVIKPLIAWAGLAAGCLALASWRLWPAYLRQFQGSRRTQVRRFSLPALRDGENPVAWREHRVEGLGVLRPLRRVPTWFVAAIVALATFFSQVKTLVNVFSGGGQGWRVNRGADPISSQQLAAVFLVTLITAIRASGSIPRERQQQTWESFAANTFIDGRNRPRKVVGHFAKHGHLLVGVCGNRIADLVARRLRCIPGDHNLHRCNDLCMRRSGSHWCLEFIHSRQPVAKFAANIGLLRDRSAHAHHGGL